MNTLHALLYGRKSEKAATAILYGAWMIPQDVPAVQGRFTLAESSISF